MCLPPVTPVLAAMQRPGVHNDNCSAREQTHFSAGRCLAMTRKNNYSAHQTLVRLTRGKGPWSMDWCHTRPGHSSPQTQYMQWWTTTLRQLTQTFVFLFFICLVCFLWFLLHLRIVAVGHKLSGLHFFFMELHSNLSKTSKSCLTVLWQLQPQRKGAKWLELMSSTEVSHCSTTWYKMSVLFILLSVLNL